MNVPGQLEKVTEELQRASAEKDELLAMKSLNEKITSLKEADIPNLESRLSDVDKVCSFVGKNRYLGGCHTMKPVAVTHLCDTIFIFYLFI